MLMEWTITGVLALISVFLGAYEMALVLMSRSRLEELLEDGKGANDHPMHSFLRQIIEGQNTIRLSVAFGQTAYLFAFVCSAFYAWFLHPGILGDKNLADGVPWTGVLLLAVATLALRGLSVVIGELDEEKLILSGAILAWFLTLPFRAFTWMFRGLGRILARSLGHKTEMSEEERREELEEEVIAAVSDGELDGVVKEDQREMIEGIFDLKDSDVADVFTPRTEMVSVDLKTALSEAIVTALEEGFSRLPVHEETRDNVKGIFYVRDALQYWGRPKGEIPALAEILRKPLFVPETKDVPDLLREMREEQTHMAIVLDEYGGTAGLVTIEDVLEEIVGDIQDEYDKDETEEPIRHLDEHTIAAEGSVHVSDINEALDIEEIPEDDDYETLAGFVLDNLGHIPQAGESFVYKSLSVKVLSADERRVGMVQLIRDPSYQDD